MKSRNTSLLATLAVAGLVAGSATAAAAGDAPASADDVTLRVLVHQNPPMTEFLEEFNATFEEANPNISIDLAVVNAQELSTVTQTRLTANDVDVIDIFGFSNAVQPYMGEDAVPPNWQTLIDAGLLLDITDQPFVANYDATATADAGTWDGSVYSVNLGRVSYSGMFVNLDLLADVGVELPTTWTELVDTCSAVKEAGNECMTAGGADGWPIFVGSYGLLGAMYPDQAALVEGLLTGEVAWDDADHIELFNRLHTYATEMLEQGVTGLAHDATPARFAAGDVAFMPTGVWQAPTLEEAEPGFEWTYVPFPGSDNVGGQPVPVRQVRPGMGDRRQLAEPGGRAGLPHGLLRARQLPGVRQRRRVHPDAADRDARLAARRSDRSVRRQLPGRVRAVLGRSRPGPVSGPTARRPRRSSPRSTSGKTLQPSRLRRSPTSRPLSADEKRVGAGRRDDPHPPRRLGCHD